MQSCDQRDLSKIARDMYIIRETCVLFERHVYYSRGMCIIREACVLFERHVYYSATLSVIREACVLFSDFVCCRHDTYSKSGVSTWLNLEMIQSTDASYHVLQTCCCSCFPRYTFSRDNIRPT